MRAFAIRRKPAKPLQKSHPWITSCYCLDLGADPTSQKQVVLLTAEDPCVFLLHLSHQRNIIGVFGFVNAFAEFYLFDPELLELLGVLVNETV
jgi:hypothetical protein